MFLHNGIDFEPTFKILCACKTAQNGVPLDVAKETKIRTQSKIVVEPDNPVFAVAANNKVEQEGFLPLPTKVMRDLSLTSNPITDDRNPTEPSFYL